MVKSNKIFITAVVIAVSGIAIVWGLLKFSSNNNNVSVVPKTNKENINKSKEVGYGWSVKDTAEEAADESIAMIKKTLQGKIPHYVLFYYTVGYSPDVIKDKIKSEFGDDTEIQGMSSLIGVMSKNGYHVGKVGSMSMLGIAVPDIKMSVAGVDLDKFSPREAGKKVIMDAMQKAGETEKPAFIYLTIAPGKEEEVLLGIEDVVTDKVPIVGGSSGDNDLSGKWSQVANDNVYKNGVVLTAIYTKLKIGTSHEFGYLTTEHRGIATKAEGRKLYEIDNRPAAEVYNEWTGGAFEKELKEGGVIIHPATFYPLAKVLKSKDTQVSQLDVFHPGYIILPEKSLTGFANIQQGDEIVLLHGSWEWLVNRAQTTAQKAMSSENIGKGEALFSYYTFCAGTLLAIPEEERSRVPLLLSDELGDVPFVGGFTLGEQVHIPGIGNRHANLVNSIAIFSR